MSVILNACLHILSLYVGGGEDSQTQLKLIKFHYILNAHPRIFFYYVYAIRKSHCEFQA